MIRKEFREQKPENVSKRNHYYCFESQGNQRDFRVEEFLGVYETKASAIIHEFKATNVMTHQNQEILSIFLGLLAVRTPRFQKYFNKSFDEDMKKMFRHGIETSVKEYFNERREEYPLDFDSLSSFIESDNYTVNADRNESIKAMLKWSIVNGK